MFHGIWCNILGQIILERCFGETTESPKPKKYTQIMNHRVVIKVYKNGREFRTFKYMFYGEGRVQVAMRTSEGHEMSEKVSVCETVMPYAKSSESDFEVAGGLIR